MKLIRAALALGTVAAVGTIGVGASLGPLTGAASPGSSARHGVVESVADLPGATTTTTVADGVEIDLRETSELGTASTHHTAPGPSELAPVHELLRGQKKEVPGSPAPGPIGEVNPDFVPEGLDLTAAFPGAPAPSANPGIGGPTDIYAGPWCTYQCIESGVAFPRGFGAELVVDTLVPADLFLSVVADYDGDGDYDDYGSWNYSSGTVDHQAWTFDDLQPGQTYYAMVTATDSTGTSYAWGEFTTLNSCCCSAPANRYVRPR